MGSQPKKLSLALRATALCHALAACWRAQRGKGRLPPCPRPQRFGKDTEARASHPSESFKQGFIALVLGFTLVVLRPQFGTQAFKKLFSGFIVVGVNALLRLWLRHKGFEMLLMLSTSSSDFGRNTVGLRHQQPQVRLMLDGPGDDGGGDGFGCDNDHRTIPPGEPPSHASHCLDQLGQAHRRDRIIRRHRDVLDLDNTAARRAGNRLCPCFLCRRLPRVLAADAFRRFYEVVDQTDDVQHSLRLCLLFDSGVTVSELCNIEVSDIDLDACKIRINQGKGSKDRHVLFGKSFATALRTRIAAHPSNRWLRRETPAVYQHIALDGDLEQRYREAMKKVDL
jgi:hypothetical protein